MRRHVPVLLLLAVLAAAATAFAQGDEPTREPDVRATEVFRMTGVCDASDRVTVRVNPSGALLSSVRIHVAGLQVLEMTGVENPASATVRLPATRDRTRVTATGDTIGGQALYRTRIYGRCGPPPPDVPGRPVIGGGED
jgi:hypothetical protein